MPNLKSMSTVTALSKATALQPICALALMATSGMAVAQSVEKCPKELGTLAVSEPQAHHVSGLSRYGLGSPSIMLRMIAQESGCFAVVERGVAMQNIQQERALAGSGQLQQGSNIGGGQLQAADFVMTPAVQFSDDTGGIGGVVGGLLGRAGGVLGALGGLAGGVKFKEAETTLLVADVRSGIQVASAEGKASKMNFSLGGWGWGGLGWAAGGGYSKTPEGKLIAASLLDNFNKIVAQIRDKPQLIRNTVQAAQHNAANATQATGVAQPVAPVMQAPMVVAAPVVVPMMTMPQRALRGQAPLMDNLVGSFMGQYSGADSGVFTVLIAADGTASGTAQSSAANGVAFRIIGMVANNGHLAMTGTVGGVPTMFNGVIAQDGAVAGTWRTVNGSGIGQFQGLRADAPPPAAAAAAPAPK